MIAEGQITSANLTQLDADLPQEISEAINHAFREMPSNAVEYSGHLDAAFCEVSELNKRERIMLTATKEKSTVTQASADRFKYKRRTAIGKALGTRSFQPGRRRQLTPKTIERVAEARLPTKFGEFRILGFCSLVSAEEFVAIVKGELRPDRASPVRIHSQCMTGDVFGSLKCDCGRQLEEAMKIIEREGHGVIVYQQQEGRGIGIINKIRAYALQDQGADTIEANELLGFEADMRCYKQCAEILLELGLRAVRVMSDNPAKIRALKQASLEIVERVRLEVELHDFFAGYLKTKKEKMGHLVSVA